MDALSIREEPDVSGAVEARSCGLFLEFLQHFRGKLLLTLRKRREIIPLTANTHMTARDGHRYRMPRPIRFFEIRFESDPIKSGGIGRNIRKCILDVASSQSSRLLGS